MFLRVGGVLFVLGIAVWLWAIFDAVTTERSRVRNLPKLAWVLLILVFTWLGAVAWALFGRPRRDGAATRVSGTDLFRGATAERRTPSGGSAARRPIGPDDDPDFLRKI